MEHPIEVHPEYLAELRRRIEAGPGMSAVAKVAKMSRMTLWGLLNDATARRATTDAAERVRHALAKLDPKNDAPPPPVVSVRGRQHYRWIELGDVLAEQHADALDRLLASPDVLKALLKTAKGARRSSR